MNSIMAESATDEISIGSEISIDGDYSIGGGYVINDGAVDNGYYGDYTGSDGYGDGTLADSAVKDPVMSSWLFVGGITVLTLAISIVIGVLFAKLRIKKGFDLYEI